MNGNFVKSKLIELKSGTK